MQEICAESGISAGALYRYFSSKAEIIGAIAEDKRREEDDTFLRAVDKFGLIEGLCLVGRSFFDKCAASGALVADIISETIRDDALARALHAADSQSVRVLAGAIRAAQQQGGADATLDPEIAASTLFAAIEGIGLRRSFLRDANTEAALSQFRALAQRYLSPSDD